MTAATVARHEIVPARPVASHVRLRRFAKNRLAVAGAVFLFFVVVLAIIPGVFAPESASSQSLLLRFQKPGDGAILGFDSLGRDVFSRVIFGARTSLVAALEASLIAIGIGVPLGLTSAYFQGRFQMIADRFNDVLMSVPALLLAIVIVGALGPSLRNSMAAIGIAFAPRFYRIARAATSDIREETFIEASRSIGCSSPRIIVKHVLPNILNTIIVQAALTVGSVILAEASMSFLGLGVQPPEPSWGLMLREASVRLYEGPHLIWGPGVMIVLTVLASQLVADGLRDALGDSREGGR